MEYFVTELYNWNCWCLSVITYNYFVHFLLYFYWLINVWRGKGFHRNSIQKCILKGESGLKLNFVVPVKWFAVLAKSSQFIRRHWLLWVLGRGQFSLASKSGVSRIQYWAFCFGRTSSSTAMNSYCSAHCVVSWLFDCESGNKYNNFSTAPWAVVYVIYSTPNNLCNYHRRNKTTMYPLISLDLFPRPWLKHFSVMMGISWLITVPLKAPNCSRGISILQVVLLV